jgi:hypothetical protein
MAFRSLMPTPTRSALLSVFLLGFLLSAVSATLSGPSSTLVIRVRPRFSFAHFCDELTYGRTCAIHPLPLSSRILDSTFSLLKEAEIAECSPVKQLSALKKEIAGDESPVMRQVFAVLFPFGPAWNSSE